MPGRWPRELDFDLFFGQSNAEGQLIDWVHQAYDEAAAVIINPAGLSTRSVALLDALRMLERPVVEVHLTNVFAREPIYHGDLLTARRRAGDSWPASARTVYELGMRAPQARPAIRRTDRRAGRHHRLRQDRPEPRERPARHRRASRWSRSPTSTPAGRAAFAAEHGVPHAYGDVDEMLASGLDAVTVCTPHAAHEAGVLAAARHRHPRAVREAHRAQRRRRPDRMVAATAAAGVRFGVLFQRRFWPAAARIRAAIDDGRLGTPICGGVVARLNRDADYYAEPWRGRRATEGGGVLMTQAIHHIDLLQWFMGPARRVTGRCATLVHQGLIEVEDTAGAVVEFASGAHRDDPGRHDVPARTRRAGLGQRRARPHGERDGVPGGRRLHRHLDHPRRGGVRQRVRRRPDRPTCRWPRSTTISRPTTPCRSRTSSTRSADDREPAVTGRDAVRSLRDHRGDLRIVRFRRDRWN